MKKVTTLFFVILCCITMLKAEEVALTVHVETPGTLADKIFDAGLRPINVTKLTVTGTLNDDDFTCMRETMTSLVDVDLSAITNTTGVNFNGKKKLVKILLPENLTSIGYRAFLNCDALTSISIPNSVTFIEEWAFNSCSSLTSITIPNSVTSIGEDAFWSCSNITEIHISDIAKWCDIDFKGSSSNPLYDSSKASLYVSGNKITDLVIPEGVEFIKKYAFEKCSSLTSITIPNSVTSIGRYAFSSCDALTSVTIGNSVTSIGRYAFLYCISLTSVTIGNSVTSIGDYTFSGCSRLTSITCLGSTPPEASDLGANTSTCTLIVPKEAYSSYLRHTYWGQFFNIEVISETPTNFETSKISSANIYTQNSTLHIEGATENYHVLDAAGRLIYSGNATTLQLPRGIYLVAMGGEVEKIVL